MHALRLIRANLRGLESDDVAARERLVVAAMLCGRGTEQGGTGLASVLAHAIGHRSHVANGIVKLEGEGVTRDDVEKTFGNAFDFEAAEKAASD